MSSYIDIESIADELDITVEDVAIVAQLELRTDEWDDDMEKVSEEGRRVIVQHFRGGSSPQ